MTKGNRSRAHSSQTKTSIDERGKVAGMRFSPERTRDSLIDAALDLFGTRGYDAASTREIARHANANIASISYHFGGKEGLRRACARHVADFISMVTSKGFTEYGTSPNTPPDQEKAKRKLINFVDATVRTLLLEARAERIVRFMLREIVNPSEAFTIVYTMIIEPTHKRLCNLWAQATGEDSNSETVRLAVFAIMGQAIYFRIGRIIVERRMGWTHYGENEVDAVAREITANLESALERHRNAVQDESS
jgi:TetR/AcrR family transcriptional regulator, regulator of cefoperazone and chloramphenicol sensitivity